MTVRKEHTLSMFSRFILLLGVWRLLLCCGLMLTFPLLGILSLERALLLRDAAIASAAV